VGRGDVKNGSLGYVSQTQTSRRTTFPGLNEVRLAQKGKGSGTGKVFGDESESGNMLWPREMGARASALYSWKLGEGREA